MADEPFKVASPEWAKKEFPKRLKMLAEAKYRKSGNSSYGWQTQLANELVIDKSNVSRWMRGSLPGVENLLRIAELLECDPAYLVGNDDAPSGDFSQQALDERIPRDLLLHVLAMMAELRSISRDVSDQQFAKATVELLDRVAERPEMNENEMTGLGLALLKKTGGE
ncbi:helix-turn-helix domain-containing protein [Salinicola acroporae]|uniref:HTH cro/C1-type domain-containing protein n=1 Tax=Salinicola acroporae TaxID=1541440 RepID=A0ABT6I475_9GAMM|nr:helix-turn-helix domain-containing protein [Salinicola acroporae]MDH4572441.1 hypothetical protein [Salinicola acroporae]